MVCVVARARTDSGEHHEAESTTTANAIHAESFSPEPLISLGKTGSKLENQKPTAPGDLGPQSPKTFLAEGLGLGGLAKAPPPSKRDPEDDLA